VRLCKARRYRYANCDMADLEAQLQAKPTAARTIMITTDGVFSMDGFIAPLDEITALAAKYGALVHIDECHATGFLGATGRGSAEVKGVMDRSTSSPARWARRWAARSAASPPRKREVIELLRQRSRPYLFSNSLPPHVVAAGIKAFDMLLSAGDLRERLRENTRISATRMTAAGFDIKPGVHPISPVMLYDAPLAQRFAERLLEEGIYAIGFLLPGRAQGPGAHPHPDERRAHPRASRSRDRCVRPHRPRSRLICRLRPSSSTTSSQAFFSPARSTTTDFARNHSPSTSMPACIVASIAASGMQSACTW
jgi:glycine C-acetyltransferase